MTNGEALGRAPFLPKRMKGRYYVNPPLQFGRVNLLQSWHDEALIHSSPLAPKPLYPRRVVNFIHRSLQDVFPASFFDHVFGFDIAARDMNVINRLLLSSKDLGAIGALAETAILIHYIREKQQELYQQLLHQTANPVQFQATLCEAYIAHGLARLGIQYSCSTTAAGVPLDGFFTLGEQRFRIECKQPFIPDSEDFEALNRILSKASIELSAHGVVGTYGIAIRVTRPVKPIVMSEASHLIAQALKRLSFGKLTIAEELVSPSKQLAIDLLPYGVLDPGKTTSEKELVVRLEVNPERDTPENVPNASVHFSSDFSFTNDDVIDRLRDIIQLARKQHRNRGDEQLVVCVDSQEHNDFRLGLLQANDSLERADVRQRIESAAGNAVVLVTRRVYTTSPRKHKAYVFNCAPHPVLEKVLLTAFAKGR